MITASMDAYDILKVVERQRRYITEVVANAEKKLHREVKRRRVGSLWKCIEFPCGGVYYRIVIGSFYKREFCAALFLYCKETNTHIKLPVGRNILGMLRDSHVQEYTPHFFRRVSERYYRDEEFDINRTITRMERDMVNGGQDIVSRLYYNEKNGDVALYFFGGIALGRYDDNRQVTTNKTYIAYDMLKDSQKRAHDAYTAVLLKQQKQNGDNLTNLIEYDESYRDSLRKELEKYQPIYEEFFKQKKI